MKFLRQFSRIFLFITNVVVTVSPRRVLCMNGIYFIFLQIIGIVALAVGIWAAVSCNLCHDVISLVMVTCTAM